MAKKNKMVDEESFKRFFQKSSGTEEEKSGGAKMDDREQVPPLNLNDMQAESEDKREKSVIDHLRRSEKQERKKLTSLSLSPAVHKALFNACGSANIHVSSYIEELIKRDLKLK